MWVSYEWDESESIDIIKSHKWSYLVGESRRRLIWLRMRFERTDQSRSCGFTMSYEMMRYWDDYAHVYVDSQWVVW